MKLPKFLMWLYAFILFIEIIIEVQELFSMFNKKQLKEPEYPKLPDSQL